MKQLGTQPNHFVHCRVCCDLTDRQFLTLYTMLYNQAQLPYFLIIYIFKWGSVACSCLFLIGGFCWDWVISFVSTPRPAFGTSENLFPKESSKSCMVRATDSPSPYKDLLGFQDIPVLFPVRQQFRDRKVSMFNVVSSSSTLVCNFPISYTKYYLKSILICKERRLMGRG